MRIAMPKSGASQTGRAFVQAQQPILTRRKVALNKVKLQELRLGMRGPVS
jgi:hypothetical protein